MTVQPEESPDIRCACCGVLMDAIWQPEMYAGMQTYWLITCRNPDCGLYQYTFASISYPPENLFEVYLKGEVQS